MMPAPLLIAAGVVGVVAAVGMTRAVMAAVTGRRPLAILGGASVGKSNLVRYLRQREFGPLEENEPPGRFSVTTSKGPIKFAVSSDLRGDDGPTYAVWKKHFLASEYVWYFFRADLVAQGNAVEVDRVKMHVDMFKGWMIKRGKPKADPKIILIGTWADAHPDYQSDPAAVARAVDSENAVKLGLLKLPDARLVVGSLRTERDAGQLTKRIEESLALQIV